MPLYFFLCLLKNKEIRQSAILIETVDGVYNGYLRGVNEQSVELEVAEEGKTTRVYIVLSKIVSIEMSKMCCSLDSKEALKCFTQFGVEKQEHYEHHPKYERYLTYQLMKHLKEQEQPNQWMRLVLTNGKKIYFQVQDLLKELEEITFLYSQVNMQQEKKEKIIVVNNEFINAIELLEGVQG